MPMSRFLPATLTLTFTGQIQRFTSCSPAIRTQPPNYRFNQGRRSGVRSLARLSSRLILCSVISATFESTRTILRTLSRSFAIIQSSSSTIPNTRYPLCGLLNAQSLHFEALLLAADAETSLPSFPAPVADDRAQIAAQAVARRTTIRKFAPASTADAGQTRPTQDEIATFRLRHRGICYILCVVRHPGKTSRLVGVVEFSITKHTYHGGLHRLLVLTNPIPSSARFSDFTRGVPCFAPGERTNRPTGARSYCFALLPSLLSDSAPSSFAAPYSVCIWSTYSYCNRQTPFHTPPPISLKLQSSSLSRIPCEEERSILDNLQATTSTGPSPSGRRGRRFSVSSNKALPTSRISPHIASSGSLGAKRDYAHPRLHSATCAGELLGLSRAATGVSVSHKRSTVTRLGRLD
ncbi:hypothetical protein CFIO01_12472 [Colletotrichum fioriniae PJ7]|uniref:Uncharacterized protein n=1 Tax=Colletotrichum fioriniae PJ7 TaxID=1445577 RepID=A0A010QKF5_9PEZI|nr:hypothetical protein CFIO01_12472 [Colletotrichum fioriniae PJ7]